MAVCVGADRGTDGSTGDGRPVKRGALEHAENVAAQIARRASLVAEYRESLRIMNRQSGKERALHMPQCPIPVDTRAPCFV
ncbi:MAG TPA: hypothetical protein VEC56_04995 [Candidatus Krumholzibacteria bacterium]|nr:hypothetical protein [Candidatus Krumholzibacteria bacterium]